MHTDSKVIWGSILIMSQRDLGDDALEVVESTQIAIQQVVHDRTYHVDGRAMPNVWKGVVESRHVVLLMLFCLITEEKLKCFTYQLKNKCSRLPQLFMYALTQHHSKL